MIIHEDCTQVVPFTPAAGLLEWVEETEPLLPYLIGDPPYRGGAWGRHHRPQDRDFVQSRAALEEVQKSSASSEAMAKSFGEVRTPSAVLLPLKTEIPCHPHAFLQAHLHKHLHYEQASGRQFMVCHYLPI